MRATVIQMQSGPDKAENLRAVERLCATAAEENASDMILLPEVFSFQGGSEAERGAAAEPIPDGPTCDFLRTLAIRSAACVHGGSFFELDRRTGLIYNATVVYDRDGTLLAHYRKIHLFDVATDGGLQYRESDLITAGDAVVTYPLGEFTVGCSICYDLRFGELYRQLAEQGANVIVVPAAFTYRTGKDHWNILLRARAIETQSYILAPAQCGGFPTPDGERHNWGHAMIVDPWGEILAGLGHETGHASAVLNPERVAAVRERMPAARHRTLR